MTDVARGIARESSGGNGAEAPTGPRILVADDQPDILKALRLLLKNEGYSTIRWNLRRK